MSLDSGYVVFVPTRKGTRCRWFTSATDAIDWHNAIKARGLNPSWPEAI